MPDITTGCSAPAGNPAPPAVVATPASRTFKDASDYVERWMDCSTAARRVLKTALRQIAWAVAMIDGKPGPLSDGQVRKTIIDTVAERVGADFHPHLFRALAVEFALKHDPGALEHCRQLLGDKTLQVILTHYAPIRTKEATDHQDRLVNAEADRLAMPLAPVKRRRNNRTAQPKRPHVPPSSEGKRSQGDG